jgi:glucose/mannose-6-phosphate isomerase
MSDLSQVNSQATADILAGVEIMLSAVRGIPQHLLQGIDLAKGIAEQLKPGIRSVTLCGLGGSAFPGNLLEVLQQELNIPLRVSRDYQLPHQQFTTQDLVIASSFSGNTEESVSSLLDALEAGAQSVVLCAGGRMAQLAQEHNLPVITMSKPTPTFQPRAGSGFFVGALCALLEDLGFFPHARQRLQAVSHELKDLMDVKQEAASIADRLFGKIPVFYAAPPFASSLARVVKIKINENTKSPAFWNEVPEFNHNEMVGYTQNHQGLIAVFFTYENDLARTQTRIQQSIKTLQAYGVDTLAVAIRPAQDILTSLFATLYLFDEVSCALAIRAGIDPNPVNMVEDFKASLGAFESKNHA